MNAIQPLRGQKSLYKLYKILYSVIHVAGGCGVQGQKSPSASSILSNNHASDHI